jgi:hypothetical protein
VRPADRYDQAVGVCRFIWEILLSPRNLTARLIPMYPVIQVIPTFGIYRSYLRHPDGRNPGSAEYSDDWDGKDGWVRQDYP